MMKIQNFDMSAAIAVGLPAGALFGIVFLNGNTGLGASIGLLAAIAFGSVASTGRQNIASLLVAIAAGAAVGALFGLALGLLHGHYASTVQQAHTKWLFGLPYKNEYVLVSTVIAAASGSLFGPAVAARTKKPLR